MCSDLSDQNVSTCGECQFQLANRSFAPTSSTICATNQLIPQCPASPPVLAPAVIPMIPPETIPVPIDSHPADPVSAPSPSTSSPTPPPVAVAVPLDSPPIYQPVPTTIPAVTLQNCVGPAPLQSFQCVSGEWVSPDSIDAATVDIPNSNVVIYGNLTVGTTLIFSGLNSSILLQGDCVDLVIPLSGVQVILSDSDVESIIQSGRAGILSRLITVNASSCRDDSNTTVASHSGISIQTRIQHSKTCQTLSASNLLKTSPDSRTLTMDALFVVTSDIRCKIWWIILVSVVGFVFAVVFLVALLATFNRKCKAKLRPFWVRKEMKRQTTKPV